MISLLLPIVTLAGVAIATCPLAIKVTGATGDIVDVTVTNTGNQTLTVFKGNTVLSDDPTRDLIVTGPDGKELPFTGIHVTYMTTGLPADVFQTILAGQTVDVSIDASKTNDLAGVAKAQVSIVQSFQYTTGATAPTELKGLLFCQAISTGTVTITPDHSTTVKERTTTSNAMTGSRHHRRTAINGFVYQFCSATQTSSLHTALFNAEGQADAASTDAANQDVYFLTWFISGSFIGSIQQIFRRIGSTELTTAGTFSCKDTLNHCSTATGMYYIPGAQTIVPCPAFFNLPAVATSCSAGYDQVGLMLHEVSHFFGADDYAYGQASCRGLSSAIAANNADSYRIYAQSVHLGGCS